MATSNQILPSTTKPPPSDAPSSRWSRSGEQGPVVNGPSRSTRGRPGRARNGGRNNKPREDKGAPSEKGPNSVSSNKSDKPAPLPKPTVSITSPPNPPTANNKPKNSSRRPSKTNSSVNSTLPSPVVEPPTTPLSRSSNRRKRSAAGRGPNNPPLPRINPPAPNDDLLRPGRPRIGAVPHTAPLKDTPPHLSHKSSHTSHGSFDMSKNIEALVERVRAVAMAENRPSTPGSHIDWAGDDDDSLPDLDDWGIPSLSEPKAQPISPIIVGGLKPLPEPSLLSASNAIDVPLGQAADEQKDTSPQPINGKTSATAPTSDGGSQRAHLHPSLPPKPQVSSNVRIANEIYKPMAPRRPRPSEESKAPVATGSTDPQPTSVATATADGQGEQAGTQHGEHPKDEASSPPAEDTETTSECKAKDSEAQSDALEVGSGGLAQSVHAPSAEERAGLKQEDGLMASIHAPGAMADSNSAPAQLGTQLSRNRNTHARAQTVGRPFPRPHDNFFNRSPRAGRNVLQGSPRQHTRNHSSPSATGNHRVPHSRPVLTGDAISRLVKTIGSTTNPSAKPATVAND